MTDPLLVLDEVVKRHPGDRPGAGGGSLAVAAGETAGLVGGSGSGKSTLARPALGLLARRQVMRPGVAS